MKSSASPVPASRAQGARWHGQQITARKANGADDDAAWRRHESEDRNGDFALAAPGFADHRQGLAGRQRERNPVDRAGHAGGRVEARLQLLNLEQHQAG